MRPRFSSRVVLGALIISIMMFVQIMPAGAAGAPNAPANNVWGVLVIAHGAAEEAWNEPVRQVVRGAQSQLPYRVELGFLEFVGGEDIAAAVSKLEAHGVTQIIAVPLFVCSASGHMEEIKYILGLPTMLTEEEAAKEGLAKVSVTAQVELTPGLDDHPLIAEILDDRIQSLSHASAGDILVLAAHGTSEPANLSVWVENMTSLCSRLQAMHGFRAVHFGFAGAGAPGIKAVVEEAQVQNPDCQTIVMPVMLSEGQFTDVRIPKKLYGLSYAYPEAGQRALLPHENMSKYISARTNDAVVGSVELREGDRIASYRIMDVALEERGKICVCAGMTFRAVQHAINYLAPDVVPERDRFIAVGPKSHGTKEAFQLLLGEGRYRLDSREHNESFYTYQVTDRQTGRTVSIRVRPEVFPEGFFELKQRVKGGTVTPQEKQAFQSLRDRVVENVRWGRSDDLFDVDEIQPHNAEMPVTAPAYYQYVWTGLDMEGDYEGSLGMRSMHVEAGLGRSETCDCIMTQLLYLQGAPRPGWS